LDKEFGLAAQLLEATRSVDAQLLEARVSALMDPSQTAALVAGIKVDDAAQQGTGVDEEEEEEDDEDEEDEEDDDDEPGGPPRGGRGLTEEEFKANIRCMFDELDKNSDGQVSKSEIKKARNKWKILRACRMRNKQQVARFFREGDLDRNGTLDFHEFFTFLDGVRQRAAANRPPDIDDSVVRAVFDAMDRNSDGWLTVGELRHAYAGIMLKAGEVVRPKRVDRWARKNLKKYDKDSSHSLDFEEFRVMLDRSGALLPVVREMAPQATPMTAA